MRTHLWLFIFIATICVFIMTPNANAWIVDANEVVAANTVYNEDILIIDGGTLTISPGIWIQLSAGHSIAITNGGTLILGNNASIIIESGRFITTDGSTATLGNSTTISFLLSGSIRLMGGTVNCNGTTFVGGEPGIGTDIQIEDGSVLHGSCDIHCMKICIIDNYWKIPSGSVFTLDTYTEILDPTATNIHYIDIFGKLKFDTGTFNINTDPATSIEYIKVNNDGKLVANEAILNGVPKITGEDLSLIRSDESEWYFDNERGIDTRGDVTMFTTLLDANNVLVGWNGIYLHDGLGVLTLDYTDILHVNTITNNYGVYIARATGGQHLIDHCTIVSPTGALLGNGLVVEATATIPTDCLAICLRISGFNCGALALNESALDLTFVEILNNNTGCRFDHARRSSIFQSSIHNNLIMGLVYTSAVLNELNESNVINNGQYEIFADAGVNPSFLVGQDNNIFSNDPGLLFLIGAFGGSTVTLADCFFNLFPPVLGIDFFQDALSAIIFNFVFVPFPVDGYLNCDNLFPKYTQPQYDIPLAIHTEIEAHNYPNPFNPSTQIEFTLPDAMDVTISVYGVDGQHIATLADGYYNKGVHTVPYTAAATLPSGPYIYLIESPLGITRGMMMLTK